MQQYKRKDPGDDTEIEMMANLFNSLCSVIALPENCKNFVTAEGTELMILLIGEKKSRKREKKLSQFGALQVLNHAMSKNISSEIFSLFVDRGGFRSLFPVFMKTPGGNQRNKVATPAEFEEHVCSIIASLFKFMKDDTSMNRLLRKFMENDYVKVERLVELHLIYYAKASKS